MTGMLASVNSLEEALMALEAGVGIIDLKQPENGALGALDTEVVVQIVSAIDHRCPVSATIGDLPMQPDLIFFATQVMANTGVDFIKIGFFPGGDWLGTINRLASLTSDHALIAVLFADAELDLAIIKELRKAKFKGVMLDTMNKQKGSLTKLMSLDDIRTFVAMVKRRSMLCGLAGSLKRADIARLLELKANYLGFRGALCLGNERTSSLDVGQMIEIKNVISGGFRKAAIKKNVKKITKVIAK